MGVFFGRLEGSIVGALRGVPLGRGMVIRPAAVQHGNEILVNFGYEDFPHCLAENGVICRIFLRGGFHGPQVLLFLGFNLLLNLNLYLFEGRSNTRSKGRSVKAALFRTIQPF